MPEMCTDDVARENRTREAYGQTLKPLWIRATKMLNYRLGSKGHGAKTMHDDARQPRHSCHGIVEMNRIPIAGRICITHGLIAVDSLRYRQERLARGCHSAWRTECTITLAASPDQCLKVRSADELVPMIQSLKSD